MKKYLVLSALIGLIIIACQQLRPENPPLFSQSMLEKQWFEIDLAKDTAIYSKSGIRINIPAGAFQTNAKKGSVRLEIREALSIADILKAGLLTRSGQVALASAGMFYINAEEGATIQKELEITVPSNQISSKMSLYKGKEDSSGKVDWVEPTPLPDNRQVTAFENGKIVFSQKCAPCHGIGNELGQGPDLAHFPKRIPIEGEATYYYYDHYRHVYATDTSVSFARQMHGQEKYVHWSDLEHEKARIYKCNLRSKYPADGPAFEGLFNSDSIQQDFYDVYRYIQTESDRLQLPLPGQDLLLQSADSCLIYQMKVWALDSAKSEFNGQIADLLNEKTALVVDERKLEPGIPEPQTGQRNGQTEQLVSARYVTSTYYQFRIKSFGWHNIDMIYNDSDGLLEGSLRVSVSGNAADTKVYLIIPSRLVLQEGGMLENSQQFGFYFRDGELKLPAQTEAWILAMQDGEAGPKYALHPFKTDTESFQFDFQLQLQTTSVDWFNQQMSKLGWDQFAATVQKTETGLAIDSIQMRLKELEQSRAGLEQLKPAGCDCNCEKPAAANPVSNSNETVPAQFASK